MTESPSHTPVLLSDVLELGSPSPGETCVDCTFGAGGHSRALSERIGIDGTLIAIDRDRAAEEAFEGFARTAPSRTRFIRDSFEQALDRLLKEGTGADLILMDLGVSSPQLDLADRGFSYSREAPLDMRMDPDQELSARQLVNEWPEHEIARVLKEYGEERHARGVARSIVGHRPLATTSDLVQAIQDGMPPAARFGRGHPAKKSFQAIRIAVNGELAALDRALPAAWKLLRVGGRLAVISFHSLEDRRAKQFLAEKARGCTCPPEFPICVCGNEPAGRLLTRRPVMAGEAEQAANPRSASARLRVAEKIRQHTEDEGGEG